MLILAHDSIEIEDESNQEKLDNDEDIRAFEEREKEPSIPFIKVLEELKSNGVI
jgi:hypothetical protein